MHDKLKRPLLLLIATVSLGASASAISLTVADNSLHRISVFRDQTGSTPLLANWLMPISASNATENATSDIDLINSLGSDTARLVHDEINLLSNTRAGATSIMEWVFFLGEDVNYQIVGSLIGNAGDSTVGGGLGSQLAFYDSSASSRLGSDIHVESDVDLAVPSFNFQQNGILDGNFGDISNSNLTGTLLGGRSYYFWSSAYVSGEGGNTATGSISLVLSRASGSAAVPDGGVTMTLLCGSLFGLIAVRIRLS